MVGLITFVRFPLLSQFPGGLNSTLATVLFQIFVRHDFATNELILKVRADRKSGEERSAVNCRNVLDNTSGLGCLGTFTDSPRSHLVGATSEIPN